MKFTTKGRIQLFRDDVLISSHVLAEEAYEKAYIHAVANGAGKYLVKYPDREIDLSSLTKTFLALPPNNFAATVVSTSQINLSWTLNPLATSYKIYRNGVLIATVALAAQSDLGLLSNTTYNYTIASVGIGGEGPQSSQVSATTQQGDTTAPTVPLSVTATAISSSEITLNWAASTDTGGSGLAGYKAEWSANGTSGWLEFNSPTTNQFVALLGIPASTQRFFRVRAYDIAGNHSGYSTVVNATTFAATVPGSELADWLARSTGTGVIWAHNFDFIQEAMQFALDDNLQNSPLFVNTSVAYSAGGLANGGYLSCSNLPGASIGRGFWGRPFAALPAGSNGKTTDDPAANGTVKLRASTDWPANPSSNQLLNFRGGLYSHLDYINSNSDTWQGVTQAFDGTEFWLQFRVRWQLDRFFGWNGPSSIASNLRTPPQRIAFVGSTGPAHETEMTVFAGTDPESFNSTYPFRVYTSSDNKPNSKLTNPQGGASGASIQSGGAYQSSCTIGGSTTTAGACWEWPRSSEWVTVLLHVAPGHDNQSDRANGTVSAWTNKDTIIECWIAGASDTEYRKVLSNDVMAWLFGHKNLGTFPNPYQYQPPSFNAFFAVSSADVGTSVPPGRAYIQQFTQVILSKDFIQCPNAPAPTWWTS